MHTLWLLLRARLRGALNSVRFATRRQRIAGGVIFVAGLLLFVLFTVGAGVFFAGVRQTAGEETALSLVRRMTSGLLLFLLAGGVPFISHVLFAPGDLPLLGAAPVSPRVITLLRLLEGGVAASTQFMVLGVPALLAGLWFAGTPWWGWLLAPVLLVLLLALPSLTVGALLFALARLFGVRRVKIVVGLLSVVLAVGVCLLAVSETTRFRLSGRLSEVVKVATSTQIAPEPRWAPTTWAGDALLGSGGKVPAARAWGSLLLLTSLTLGMGTLGVWLGAPLMAQGERLRDGDGTSRRGDSIGALLRWLPLSAPVRTLIAKDLRYVVRDLTLLSQVGVPLILYIVPFVLAPEAARVGAGKQEIMGLTVFSVGFIAYMMCSILGLSSVGLEGRAFWLLKASPITARQIITAKWWTAFLPTTLITLLLCLIACLALGAEPWALLVALGTIPIGCGALCGIEVGLSGIFPRFIFENPAHRASVAALIWGFVAATSYALLALVPLVGMVFGIMGQHAVLAVGSGALFLLLSFCVGFFPLRLAAHRLETYAWEN